VQGKVLASNLRNLLVVQWPAIGEQRPGKMAEQGLE
jgi:hypothetical protein